MDVDMEDVTASVAVMDMGYEDCAPTVRRGSMTHLQEKERRASIKAVMADPSMSPAAKRRSIQHLMDGRRNSINGGNVSVCSSNGGEEHIVGDTSNNHDSPNRRGGRNPRASEQQQHPGWNDMGYGDGAPDSAMNNTQDYDDYTGSILLGGIGGVINNEQTRRAEQTRPHCPHYDRHCTMIAPCCGAAFGCRICHDECPAL
jgi:hypothetical protein